MVDGGVEEKKATFLNKKLVVILAVLIVSIVGLVVVIAIVSNGGDNVPNVDSSETHDQHIDTLIENDKSYQISLEISRMYNGDEKEESFKKYDEELNKALAAQDYDLYNELITAMSTMLSLDGTCEELMAQYDKISIDDIPKEYRESIYENAIYDSTKCGDNERQGYWEAKSNEG